MRLIDLHLLGASLARLLLRSSLFTARSPQKNKRQPTHPRTQAAPANNKPQHNKHQNKTNATDTSGTTGDPKGVLLTHAAVVAAVSNVKHYLKEWGHEMGPGDSMLSYLPLAHIFDR